MHLRSIWPALASALAFALALHAVPALADTCSDLIAVPVAGATITAAGSVPAGSFTTPAQVGLAPSTFTVPAFCRVQLSLATQALVEVWLPASWNGRFEGAGNGGEFGAIIYSGLDYAISAGYAGASTDLGHESTSVDATWALNRADLVNQFGYAATHDMTVAAKTLIQAFYGAAPSFSYFYGSSSGGRQALMEAQLYPADYNGIAALSPAIGWTHIMSGMIAQNIDLGGSAGSPSQLTSAQATALNKAVVGACDTLDGVKDGIITDPTQCHFDPSTLACKRNGKPANCLSSAQIAAVQKLYSPLTDASGNVVYAGLPYGSEYEWFCSVSAEAFNFPLANSWYQNEVYANPQWDFTTFNVNVDVPYADSLLATPLNASSPDMDGFKAAGGKLLIAQGQADAVVVPLNTIAYFNTVSQRYGSDTASFARLFMEPGVGHCGPAAPGPNVWDPIAPLANWVEHGAAPASIIAYGVNSSGSITVSRPLCPYPQQALYSGKGSTSSAKNFSCAAPPQAH